MDGSCLLALHSRGSARLIAIRLPQPEAVTKPVGFEVNPADTDLKEHECESFDTGTLYTTTPTKILHLAC